MLNFRIFLVPFIFKIILCCETSKSELLSVIVIFRHGDRTILFPYPNDPYNDDKYWPEGLSQLTELGKQQCFELGMWLRKRYDDFLPSVYHMKDIHFRSTNRDRSLMSGGYLAGGLYYTIGKPLTVVPIHTKPILEDKELLMRSTCPRYDYLKLKLFKSSPYREIHGNYSKLFEFLSYYSGSKVEDVDGVQKLYDTLKMEKKRNLTLPDWTTNIFPEPMKSLSLMSITAEAYTKEMARLKVGLLLHWILKHFNAVLETYPPNFYIDMKSTDYYAQKFVVFCAHDHVIVNLLQAFGIFDMRWPHVSAALIFEYRRKWNIRKNGKKFINLLYKNSEYEASQLTIKNCTTDCFIEDFKDALYPYEIDEKTWIEECYIK